MNVANDRRIGRVFDGHLRAVQSHTDRIFAWLFVGQWMFGVICAVWISPRTWVEMESHPHLHLWAATLLGGVIISLPLALIAAAPGTRLTRYVVAAAQLIYSALLIHLMGGRIEAHFHIFGSLAILAFYRDAGVLVPAILLFLVDHLVRGAFWPESVFGVIGAAPWRAFEHAGWVLFESGFLLWGIRQSRKDLLDLSRLQVSLTDERDLLEGNVERRVVELKQQQLLLQEVVDNIPGCIYWKDSSLRYLGCNNAFATAVGATSPSGVIGERDDDLPWDLTKAQSFRQCDAELMETRVAKLNVEESCRCADGRRMTLLTSKVPLLNSAGEAVGVIGIFQDITDRKQLEAQLSQAQKLESIGQLAAGIAHEINTPMQCVGGNVEFLKNCYERVFNVVDRYRTDLEGPPRPWRDRKAEMVQLIAESRFDHLRIETPAAIEEASEAVQRVIEIVRAMKAMSHPGTKAKVSTNLNELLRNAAAISKNRWKYVAEVQMALEEPLPDVKALPAELSQVFLNLIVNAADAIAEKPTDDESLGKITIRTFAVDGGVRIEVSDTGAGVTEEVRHRIFDPFFTTKEVGKGTGQGLAIAYDLIVNKHQGEIALNPGIGVGATFSVWLPCQPTSVKLDEFQEIESDHGDVSVLHASANGFA
jgi:PAS domain S-box-containing protein